MMFALRRFQCRCSSSCSTSSGGFLIAKSGRKKQFGRMRDASPFAPARPMVTFRSRTLSPAEKAVPDTINQSPSETERSSPTAPAQSWQTPNRDAALAQYRRRARFYDLELALIEPVRRRAIELLGLKGGETVLDVGCGTGLSFELLEQRIGREGRIVAIEQSTDMLEQARARAD